MEQLFSDESDMKYEGQRNSCPFIYSISLVYHVFTGAFHFKLSHKILLFM